MSRTVFAAEFGEGDTVLVLLHGFGGTHAIWDGLVPQLSETCRVLAYDLPGHGGSLDVPDAGPAPVAAKAIHADLAGRGIERFHLCGHSMGGAIAALMALGAPEKVVSLTLLAPGGFGPEINGRLLRRFAAVREAGDIRDCLEAMSGWSAEVSDAAVNAALAAREVPGQSEKLIEIAGKIAKGDRQGEIPRDKLASLTMPVKVVWGTQDTVLPTRQAHKLPPRFAAHVYESTGHMLAEEIPGEVIHLVQQNMR